MAKRPQRPVRKPTSGSRIDQVRSRLTGQPAAPAGPQARRRRVPRYEIEARRERMIRQGIAALAVAIVVILVGAFLWTNVILPRQTVATVAGVNISREDYWKARAVDLWNQGTQFQQFAQMVDPSMAQQYQQLAAQSVNQIPNVWGSTDIDSGTLNRMIDDQIYLQSLDELGITLTDEEIELFMLNQYADPTIPVIPPTSTPTFTPDRAAMATATAQALAATPQATPGTPLATPIAEGSAASPVATPLASPMAADALGTPSPEEARAIAESNFTMFERALFERGHLTRDDYKRLVAAPGLARSKIDGAIAAEVGQQAEQVHAAHILVETQDLARELHNQLAEGADFADLAIANSIDEGTAPNGGDLGWFTRDEMVAPFAEAAFALEPGDTSEPVQSEFGWHIIHVFEHDPDRALTDQQITRLTQSRVAAWLEERRAELEISSSLPPTPTPLPDEFVAPVEAPPPPTPTPLPEEIDAAASPQAAASPAPLTGSPVATP